MFASNTSQVANDAVFIEDTFSTTLYTGNGSTQTITNGIDLAGEGGMVWTKNRSSTQGNAVFDTARGNTKYLLTQTTDAQQTSADDITSFLSNGYTLGNNATTGNTNYNNYTYASWTFRKAPKFFDVVTYTGNGGTTRTINHNLASVPGCIIIKATSTTSDWWVTHRNNGSDAVYGSLNLTDAMNPFGDPMTRFATSTEFYPRLMDSSLNTNGVTYVAYLFAHNAGGFGLTGTDNVISCGSFTGPTATVDLGYEPQWLLTKRVDSTGNWTLMDTMRGLVGSSSSGGVFLQPNTSNAENAQGQYTVNATGFNASVGVTSTFIYIAIRRGPMKTPTSGTSVFAMAENVSNSGVATSGFPVDAFITTRRSGVLRRFIPRLTNRTLVTNTTASETDDSSGYNFQRMDGIQHKGMISSPNFWWMFKRAPGFFDVVCYTGNGTNGRAITHNLGVAPEMIIVKKRTGADGWVVWASGLTSRLYELYLNDARAQFVEASPRLNVNNAPTSTQFEVGTDGEVNASGATYVAYLFATCAGVSKVGSYTGTGTTQVINCGFTAGSRFVLIKRTDSSGDWYVWDSARGIVSGNDPYLLLNNTDDEVTYTDYIDTYSAGFEISSTAPAAINASGGTFIFLAIA